MTNDEAKELYVNAVNAFESKDYKTALAVFDQLDAARPNSRHVTYHRVICLANLGRKHEAESNFEKIEGKLEGDKIAELKRLLHPDAASVPTPDPVPPVSPTPAPPVSYGAGDNVLVIESAFSKSTDETTITGHIKAGTFRVGDSLTIVTSEGMPIVAPIVRIGTTETPLKMARAGQKAIMLIQVESHYVVPGSTATCISQEESYAETMVVGINDGAEAVSSASQADGEYIELERMIRTGNFSEALSGLSARIEQDPGSCVAHRMLAKIYLDGGDGIRDDAKALEHVRKAYELGGAEDPVVVDLLAQAMAANGEAEHGLRFLERLYAGTREFEAKAALAQRIIAFRDRHKLGHVWEFSDTYGDVIFESGDIQEIARAIKSETVPKTSLCKKDRVGEWRKVEETIALEHESIGALVTKDKKASGKPSYLLYIIIALLVATIVVVLINILGSSPADVEEAVAQYRVNMFANSPIGLPRTQ